MPSTPRPLVITGATGTLGTAFQRVCALRGLACHLTTRAELDIADRDSVEGALDRFAPWAVVNTAGYVRVDDAETDRDRCYRENLLGPALLAERCASRGIGLVTFSSDLVFNGTKGSAYVESDPVSPLNVYGDSKAQAELAVLKAHPTALVLRTSAFFGPWDNYNFVTIALRELAAGRPFRAISVGAISPTYVPDLVNAALDLLIDHESGIWHLANEGSLSWSEFAERAAALAGVPPTSLVRCTNADLHLPAPRPDYSVLSSERGKLLPSLEDALQRYMRERMPVLV